MTNLEALKAEVEPYTLTDDGYVKRLIDAGLSENGVYVAANKIPVAKCAVSCLVSLLALTNETLGPTAQSYDRRGLEEKLKSLCDEAGLDSEDYITQPTVRVYRNLF